MIDTVKPGDRVKVLIEGTVTDTYGDSVNLDGNCLAIMTEAGEVFVETQKILKPFVEKVRAPLADGLYYLTPEVPQPPQISLVYKHEEGRWYDNLLQEYTPVGDFLDRLAPLQIQQ